MKRQHLVNFFNASAHNQNHYRVGYQLIPGKPASDWSTHEAAACGNLPLLHVLEAQGKICTNVTADTAARNGRLDMIHYLRAQHIDCTFRGADWAAARGHVHVIRDLYAHGIVCSSVGANLHMRDINVHYDQFGTHVEQQTQPVPPAGRPRGMLSRLTRFFRSRSQRK